VPTSRPRNVYERSGLSRDLLRMELVAREILCGEFP
jgi:hypothetical protein